MIIFLVDQIKILQSKLVENKYTENEMKKIFISEIPKLQK